LVKKLSKHDIYVSNASACNCIISKPSHVLKAIGLSDKEALSSLRFSLGLNNTKEELLYTINIIIKELENL